MALFDSTANWSNDTIGSTYKYVSNSKIDDPLTYNFRNDYYVVSYIGWYRLNTENQNKLYDDVHWNHEEYDTVESLTGSTLGVGTMGYADNHVDVYYAKMEPETMYMLHVGYNAQTDTTNRKNL